MKARLLCCHPHTVLAGSNCGWHVSPSRNGSENKTPLLGKLDGLPNPLKAWVFLVLLSAFSYCNSKRLEWKGHWVRFISSCHPCDYITRKGHLVLSEQPIHSASQEAHPMCYPPTWSVWKLTLLGLHGEYPSDLWEQKEVTYGALIFLNEGAKCLINGDSTDNADLLHEETDSINLRLQEAPELWLNYKRLLAWPCRNTWTDFQSQSLQL